MRERSCATCRHAEALDRRPCLSCHEGSRHRITPEERRARLYVALLALAVLVAILWAGTMDYQDLVKGITP